MLTIIFKEWRMREISEYKLIGYYLLKIYEKSGFNGIKYEQAKQITENVFKNISSTNYDLKQIDTKQDIVKRMIYNGQFKTANVNGVSGFVQIRTFEIVKHIFVTYNCDGLLTFKLPKDINQKNTFLLQNIKTVYESSMNLDLKLAIDKEIYMLISKQLKNRSYV